MGTTKVVKAISEHFRMYNFNKLGTLVIKMSHQSNGKSGNHKEETRIDTKYY